MAVRVFGRFRECTQEQARAMKVAVRVIFRMGKCQEGKVAAACQFFVSDDDWKAIVSKLVEFGIIETFPSGWGNARHMVLTGQGKQWGMEECCAEQREAIDDNYRRLRENAAAEVERLEKEKEGAKGK